MNMKLSDTDGKGKSRRLWTCGTVEDCWVDDGIIADARSSLTVCLEPFWVEVRLTGDRERERSEAAIRLLARIVEAERMLNIASIYEFI